jgi:hypothetical protein
MSPYPELIGDLRAEIDHLRQWKAEAIQVLNDWEDVWVAAGQPGPLGGSKAANTEATILALQIENETLRLQIEELTAPPTRIPPVVVVPITDGDAP